MSILVTKSHDPLGNIKGTEIFGSGLCCSGVKVEGLALLRSMDSFCGLGLGALGFRVHVRSRLRPLQIDTVDDIKPALPIVRNIP